MLRLGRLTFAVVLALLAIATPAAYAQEGLDPDTFETFGGTYMSDCANNAAPRVTLFKDAVVYLEGDKRIAGKNVMAAASFYGQDVPETYLTAILSDVDAAGNQLRLIVSQDAEGYYVTLDPDPAVLSKISAAMREKKFRRCDSAGTTKAAAPPVPAATKAPPPGSPIGLGVTASGMLADRKFKTAYHKALGARVREPWLANLDGPSVETTMVKVAGAEYMLVVACKNHDCYDHSTVLLWSPAKKLVYGLVHQAGRNALLGAPTPAIATELRTLWKAQWRANE